MAANIAVPTYKTQLGAGGTGVTTTYSTFATTQYTAVFDVRQLSGPSFVRDFVDVSHFDSPTNRREYLGGMIDGGEVTFDINFGPGSASHNFTGNGLLADFSMTFPRNWCIRYHPGQGASTTATSQAFIFGGFITNFEPSAAIGDAHQASVTIKIATDVTLITNAATIG